MVRSDKFPKLPQMEDVEQDQVSGLVAALRRLPQGELGYAERTDAPTFTASGDVGLEVTVTVGTGRRIRVIGQGGMYTTGVSRWIGDVMESSTILGRWGEVDNLGATPIETMNSSGPVLTPSSGSHTYKLAVRETSGATTLTIFGDVTVPAYIVVEDIGAA